MDPLPDVAIVGAGPYGLSIAAYLKAAPVSLRIFGKPMHSWHAHTPKGMRLKSEGFASNIHFPGVPFRLADYCAERGIPYADVGVAISAEAFVDYGLEFHRRYVPEVEDRQLVRLERSAKAFRLWFDSGECVTARKVVLATGLGHYTSIPSVLADLPEPMLSHSWNCSGLGKFSGRKVAVIGAGASALNSAATLLQGGASVTVLARANTINFHSPPGPQPRSLRERIRWPQTGLGTGWRSVFCTEAPLLFHRLPERTRHQFVRNHLGPAPGWFVRDQMVGDVQFQTGVTVERAEMHEQRVRLHVRQSGGETRTIEADHVVAGTGFDIDLRKLPFLTSDLLAELRMEDHKPALSSHFESSVPGLYFVGTAASFSFGPMLRFTYGAEFAAHQISRHLAATQAASQRMRFPAASQPFAVKT
jgi:cation diffusion facilitator CzcD-associated flavoprotein CzcO